MQSFSFLRKVLYFTLCLCMVLPSHAFTDDTSTTDQTAIDPVTGFLIDPATGLPIDPATGLPMPAEITKNTTIPTPSQSSDPLASIGGSGGLAGTLLGGAGALAAGAGLIAKKRSNNRKAARAAAEDAESADEDHDLDTTPAKTTKTGDGDDGERAKKAAPTRAASGDDDAAGDGEKTKATTTKKAASSTSDTDEADAQDTEQAARPKLKSRPADSATLTRQEPAADEEESADASGDDTVEPAAKKQPNILKRGWNKLFRRTPQDAAQDPEDAESAAPKTPRNAQPSQPTSKSPGAQTGKATANAASGAPMPTADSLPIQEARDTTTPNLPASQKTSAAVSTPADTSTDMSRTSAATSPTQDAAGPTPKPQESADQAAALAGSAQGAGAPVATPAVKPAGAGATGAQTEEDTTKTIAKGKLDSTSQKLVKTDAKIATAQKALGAFNAVGERADEATKTAALKDKAVEGHTELQKLAEKRATVEQQIADKKTQVDAAQNEMDAKGVLSKAADAEVARLTAANASANEIKAAVAEQTTKANELKAAEDAHNQAKKELTAHEAEKTGIIGKQLAAVKTLETEQKKLEAKQQDLSGLKTKLATAHEKEKKLIAEKTEIDKKLKAATDTKRVLQGDSWFSGARRRNKDAITAKTKEINALKQEQKAAQGAITAHRDQTAKDTGIISSKVVAQKAGRGMSGLFRSAISSARNLFAKKTDQAAAKAKIPSRFSLSSLRGKFGKSKSEATTSTAATAASAQPAPAGAGKTNEITVVQNPMRTLGFARNAQASLKSSQGKTPRLGSATSFKVAGAAAAPVVTPNPLQGALVAGKSARALSQAGAQGGSQRALQRQTSSSRNLSRSPH